MSSLLQSAKENLAFLGICLLIFLALVAIAVAAEHLCGIRKHRVQRARYVSFVAMFSAIAAILMFFEIPLFFAPSFYEIDLSEIPLLICSFYLGPLAGVIGELVKVIIKLVLKGTTTAFVGDFANFVVGCSLILPASIYYHVRKSKRSAIHGMIIGTAVMTVFGSLFNAVYLLPKFAELYGMPLDAIIGMGTAINPYINNVSTLVLMAVVPFNILKGVVVSLLTMVLYKRVEKLLLRLGGH